MATNRTHGPIPPGTVLGRGSIGGSTPFVNNPYTSESLTQKLNDLEGLYTANPMGSRSTFVRSQMKLIADTYSYFATELNNLSQLNLNIPIESILAAGTTAIGEYVPEPFGVLVKGFTYLFTKIGAQAAQENAKIVQDQATYYIGQLNQLQSLYSNYQAELNRTLWFKVLLIGVPAFLLYIRKRKEKTELN